jgi:hypothetical protein
VIAARATPRRLALAAALAATCAAASPAGADPLPVTLTSHAGRVVASVDLSPVLPRGLPERLGNGLRNVVAVYVGVVPVGREEATAAYVRVFDVLYDVWEETWSVTVRDPRTPGGRRQILGSAEALRALLARVGDADLGPIAALPPSPFTVDVRVDVNPISPELLATTREYLAGAASARGASRSVLGTMAGFLLREPDEEDDSLLFRSRPLSADAVTPR